MSNFTRQYNQLLTPEGRISKSLIRPRNIYRIVTYKDAEPATKSGENARYVFVIGKLQDRIHCIKINPIKPIDFTKFLNRIRDKKKAFKDEQYLDELLKDFTKDGKSLFETYIKPNPKVYSSTLANYRVYLLKNIVNCWEIKFEKEVLQNLFSEETQTITQQRDTIQNEINENDG